MLDKDILIERNNKILEIVIKHILKIILIKKKKLKINVLVV